MRVLTTQLVVQFLQRAGFWLVLYAFGYLRWDLRWLIFAVGIGYLLYMWRRQRLEKAAAAAAAENPNAAQEKGDLASCDHPDLLPSWVVHPDTQRAEWLNKIIRQLWPHVEEFLKTTLKSVEEDERLLSDQISSIRFPQVNLGRIAPKIGGVKVHGRPMVSRDEIMLDVNLQYSGDLHVGVEVSSGGKAGKVLPTIKASIHNVSFKGTLRMHFRPLLQDIPFVGGVTVSFLRPPAIDFDLGGVASAFELPGLGILLRRAIAEQIDQALVLPNSVSASLVPLGDGENLTDLIESTSVQIPAGVLTVQMVEAKGLVNKDITFLGQGKSDPYARVKILADGDEHSFKTAVVPDNLHPVWRMVVDVAIDKPDTLQDLHIEVWDDDQIGKDDFLGRCTIPVQVIRTAMASGQTQDVWKLLEGVKRGSFHAQVGWAEVQKIKPQHFPPSDLYPHRGVLSLFVDSCSNLICSKEHRVPSPCVKAELGGVSETTDVVTGTGNPVFTYKMNFLVADPASDTLKVTVFDERKEETLGTMRFNVSDLLERKSMSIRNNIFTLRTRNVRAERSPQITLSAAFRYIHRPKTSSYGVHQSLHDLHKIMTATASAGTGTPVAGQSNKSVKSSEAGSSSAGKQSKKPGSSATTASIASITRKRSKSPCPKSPSKSPARSKSPVARSKSPLQPPQQPQRQRHRSKSPARAATPKLLAKHAPANGNVTNGDVILNGGREVLINGYHSPKRSEKQQHMNHSKSYPFGEGIKGIKHIDDEPGTSVSPLPPSQSQSQSQPQPQPQPQTAPPTELQNHQNNFVNNNNNNVVVDGYNGKPVLINRFLVTNGDATMSSTSTASFPEFTEKLTEASEFVKKNPVDRRPTSSTGPSNTPQTKRNATISGHAGGPTVKRPRIRLGLKYSAEHHLLSVIVHKVRNLQETPHTTLPCPYVKTYTIESVGIGCNRRHDNSKRKTKTMRNTVHPVFEETLDYVLNSTEELRYRRLEVSVCSDRGILGRNAVLCRCIVSLTPLHEQIVAKSGVTADVTEWYTLTAPVADPADAANGGSKRKKIRRSWSFGSPSTTKSRSSTATSLKNQQYGSKASL